MVALRLSLSLTIYFFFQLVSIRASTLLNSIPKGNPLRPSYISNKASLIGYAARHREQVPAVLKVTGQDSTRCRSAASHLRRRKVFPHSKLLVTSASTMGTFREPELTPTGYPGGEGMEFGGQHRFLVLLKHRALCRRLIYFQYCLSSLESFAPFATFETSIAFL